MHFRYQKRIFMSVMRLVLVTRTDHAPYQYDQCEGKPLYTTIENRTLDLIFIDEPGYFK